MLTLTRVYLRTDRPRVGQKALPNLAESIRESTRLASRTFFRPHVAETGEVVRAREGSVEIVVVVTTVYVFIRDYHNIKKNLRDILKDIRAVGRVIRSIIVEQPQLQEERIEASRVTTGYPGQLEGLRKRVAQRKMSYKNAHKKAVDLYERGAGVKVPKPLSDGLLEFFREAASGPIEPWNSKKASGAAVSARRRFFGRGVRLERKPGEEKVWSGPSS